MSGQQKCKGLVLGGERGIFWPLGLGEEMLKFWR